MEFCYITYSSLKATTLPPQISKYLGLQTCTTMLGIPINIREQEKQFNRKGIDFLPNWIGIIRYPYEKKNEPQLKPYKNQLKTDHRPTQKMQLLFLEENRRTLWSSLAFSNVFLDKITKVLSTHLKIKRKLDFFAQIKNLWSVKGSLKIEKTSYRLGVVPAQGLADEAFSKFRLGKSNSVIFKSR